MYKSRRRPWVKLYCREWLTSTVRFGLTESDRSRFIDLLALAGDSKIPGVVCAGYEHGKPSGYPIDWLASTMRCEASELQKSLEKFVQSDRVSITGTDDQPIIRISAWKRYQSEYLRQVEAVKSRKSQSSSTQLGERSNGTSTQLRQTEVEGETETEVEVDTEEAETVAAFAAISCKPFGSKKFKEIWTFAVKTNTGGSWADAMEGVIQQCQCCGVKVPGRFFAHKREIEKIEAEQAYKRVPL